MSNFKMKVRSLMVDRRKYTDETFKNKLLDSGYIYISGDYINSYSKFKCYDEEGYIGGLGDI